METRTRPNNPCKNEHCGNTIYEPTYAFDADCENPKPIWRCCNCHKETPRTSYHRRTNRSRAFAEWDNLKREWAATDAALRNLVDAGKCVSGALLVHSSAFSYHMRQLCENKKPSSRDIKHHAIRATEDLDKAKQFVAEKSTDVPLTEIIEAGNVSA